MERGGRVPPSRRSVPSARFSVPHRDSASPIEIQRPPPSRFSDPFTKRTFPRYLDDKIDGNSKKSNKIPAEVSSDLRQRSFFFGTHVNLGAKFRTKIVPVCGLDFFLFFDRILVNFVLISAALQLRLDTAAKASCHAIFYSLSAACKPCPTRKASPT